MTRTSGNQWVLLGVGLLMTTAVAFAQQTIDTTPSKKTLEDAAAEGCDGVSSVMLRCADQAAETAKRDADRKSDDPLTRSRAATKAAFDRRDQRGRDDALKGDAPTSTPVGDAQRIGGVEVTGKADHPASVEEVIQKALNPQVQSNGNGTTSRYAPNGSRYDCIEKCVGPACCVEVRSMPDPARNSNSIGH